jgi:hypothetical protein
MVFNATFNNISALSWRSVLLVEAQLACLAKIHEPQWEQILSICVRSLADCTHMSIGGNMVCFAGQRCISLKENTSSASASEVGRIRTLTHVLRESLEIIE